jgi:hypothetical protein
MRLIRLLFMLVFVAVHAIAAVMPQVVCVEADGTRSIESAMAPCCTAQENAPLAPGGVRAIACAGCTDTPLAGAAAPVERGGRTWLVSPCAFAQVASHLHSPQTVHASPVQRHAPTPPPADHVLEAHRTVVLTV